MIVLMFVYCLFTKVFITRRGTTTTQRTKMMCKFNKRGFYCESCDVAPYDAIDNVYVWNDQLI